jgi:hypothetical protein
MINGTTLRKQTRLEGLNAHMQKAVPTPFATRYISAHSSSVVNVSLKITAATSRLPDPMTGPWTPGEIAEPVVDLRYHFEQAPQQYVGYCDREIHRERNAPCKRQLIEQIGTSDAERVEIRNVA